MHDERDSLKSCDNIDGYNKNIVSEDCEVTVNQRIKDTEGTYILRLKNKFIASNFNPGQFVMLKVNAGCFEPLLSRPFSIFNKFNENEFEILYRVCGKATDILSNIPKGGFVNIVGPLGNGFKIDKSAKRKVTIVVAGGIGVAPLYSIPTLIDKDSDESVNSGGSDSVLPSDNHKIILYYGARKAEDLYFRYSIHSRFDEVYFATDDGSFGFKGSIIQLLSENIKQYIDEDVSFYACGPKPMLKALADNLGDINLSGSLQLSLEEHFGCGIGVCLGCVVKCAVPDSDNMETEKDNFIYKRVCKDGPVFFANQLFDYGNAEIAATEDRNIDVNGNIGLSVKLGKLLLDYPVMPASGTFGYGEEFAQIVDYTYFGALVSKGISLEPSKGNEMSRISETHCGLINSIGLQNVGFKRFKEEKLPILRNFHKPIIVNFFGKNTDEYVRLAEMLSRLDGIGALEANISCPNIKDGGRSFGSDPEVVYNLISSVKRVIGGLPLIVKLAPMVTDISLIAKACEAAGADVISLINTVPSTSIDIKTKRFKLNRGFGGLSGPAVKPIALKLVNDVYNSVKIPIIGIGGIGSYEDAIEFFLAGATAVGVGTCSFVNPKIIPQIVEGIRGYLTDNGFDGIYDIIGLADKNRGDSV